MQSWEVLSALCGPVGRVGASSLCCEGCLPSKRGSGRPEACISVVIRAVILNPFRTSPG